MTTNTPAQEREAFSEVWRRLPVPGEYDAMDKLDQQRWRALVEAAFAEGLSARSLPPAQQPLDIDWLAQVIRIVDGSNTLGAGELAEQIVAALAAAPAQPPEQALEAIRTFWQPHTQSNVDRMSVEDMHAEADELSAPARQEPSVLTDESKRALRGLRQVADELAGAGHYGWANEIRVDTNFLERALVAAQPAAQGEPSAGFEAWWAAESKNRTCDEHDKAWARLGWNSCLLTQSPAAQGVVADAERESRGMFVARIENMDRNGDKWLTTTAVLALLNDCDMLAARTTQHPQGDGKP